MRKLLRGLLAAACAAAFLSQAAAQPPGEKPAKEPGTKAKDFSESPLVKRMMAFDKNKDVKLTREEVTDRRLHRLFDMADAARAAVDLCIVQGLRRRAVLRRAGPRPGGPRSVPAALERPGVCRAGEPGHQWLIVPATWPTFSRPTWPSSTDANAWLTNG